jgi:hypothetical protein
LEEILLSTKIRITLAALAAAMLVFSGCKGEEEFTEPEAFSFVVYPGSTYLGQLTETAKNAHKIFTPGQEPPPTAIYDTDAPMEQVAEFYAEEYGYTGVAPDQTNNLSAAKPPAFYRTGDLQTDTKAIEEVIRKLNLTTDVTKAQGLYKAAEIQGRPNRPRVTVQRPYFNVLTSQVVDRTLILMSR